MGKENVKKKQIKKKKRTGLKIFLVILLVIGIAGGVFAYKIHKNGGGLEGFLATSLGHDETTVDKLETMYCVILGQSQNLTDTIMLVAYNPKEQEASLLSIPRDTFVGTNKNRATAYDKINALCQYQYPEKTVAAIRELTGIDVTKYILIDTKALVKVVDLIGGVWFDVPIDMNYTSASQGLYIDLKKGYQLLDGESAEELVRFRHNADGTTYPEEYGLEDVGRTRTQREFLTAVAKQTLTPQNLFKIGGFIDIFYENVKTNLYLSEIKDYLPYAVNYNADNLKTGILPGTSELCNGVWIYTHDKQGSKEIVQELFGHFNKESDVTTSAKIEILNGTGDDTIMDELIGRLKSRGYDIISNSVTTETARTSIIDRTENYEDSKTIKNILEIGIVTKTDEKGTVDLTIVLGKDFLEKNKGN